MSATKQTRTLASLPVNSECEIVDITIEGYNYIVTGYYTTDENEVKTNLLITENQLDKYLSEFYSIEEINKNTLNGKYLVRTDDEGENPAFIPFYQFIDENKYDLFYNLIKETSGKL
jgi:hypothetical protein